MFRFVLLLLLGACGRFGFDPSTAPVIDESWQLRLTFDNAGRETLIDVPVLVTLDPSRFDYGHAQSDAGDLRFLDSDDSPLPYEIELWNPGATSRIWVRVPAIDADSQTDYISAVYGRADAVDGQDPAAAWAEYAGVWHLAQAPGSATKALDSSPNHNDGSFEPSMNAQNLVDGRIGRGLTFDGIDDFVEIADAPSLHLTTLTIEGWVRVPALGTQHALVSKDGPLTDTTGSYVTVMRSSGSIGYQTNNLSPGMDVKSCCAVAGQWHYFAFTLDSAAMSRAYLDGVLHLEKADVSPLAVTTSLMFARLGSATGDLLLGELDEIRLASAARSIDWLAAQYASMTDALLTYGPEEPR